MGSFRRLLTAASLTVFVVVVIAYPASFYRTASVRRLGPGLLTAARVGSGRLFVLWQSHPPAMGGRSATAVDWSATVGPVRERFFRANQRWRQTIRFDVDVQRWQSPAHGKPLVARTVIVPLWAPGLAAAVLPAMTAERRLTRRRRRRLGRCPTCGYDLRHAGDRCPECGSAVDRVTA